MTLQSFENKLMLQVSSSKIQRPIRAQLFGSVAQRHQIDLNMALMKIDLKQKWMVGFPINMFIYMYLPKWIIITITIPKTTKQVISIHIIIQFYIRPHLTTAYWKTEGKRKAQGCRNTDRKIFDRKKKKILIIHKSTTDLIQILTDSKFLMSIGVTVQWKHKLIRVAHYRTPEIIEGTSRTRK